MRHFALHKALLTTNLTYHQVQDPSVLGHCYWVTGRASSLQNVFAQQFWRLAAPGARLEIWTGEVWHIIK